MKRGSRWRNERHREHWKLNINFILNYMQFHIYVITTISQYIYRYILYNKKRFALSCLFLCLTYFTLRYWCRIYTFITITEFIKHTSWSEERHWYTKIIRSERPLNLTAMTTRKKERKIDRQTANANNVLLVTEHCMQLNYLYHKCPLTGFDFKVIFFEFVKLDFCKPLQK